MEGPGTLCAGSGEDVLVIYVDVVHPPLRLGGSCLLHIGQMGQSLGFFHGTGPFGGGFHDLSLRLLIDTPI